MYLNKSKKSQILIFSMVFLGLILVFFNYIETNNSYITNIDKFSMAANIISQTCLVAIESNGTYIQSRLVNFSYDVNNVCVSKGIDCNLNIFNNTVLPSNLSNVNYTLFTYHLYFNYSDSVYNNTFKC